MQSGEILEVLHDLRKQHKEIFGLIDLKSQTRKFGEELCEFYQAKKVWIDKDKDEDLKEYQNAKEEAADCLIVIAGIMNVDEHIGFSLLNLIDNEGISTLLYKEDIDKKMIINKNRKKIKVDGVIYHES